MGKFIVMDIVFYAGSLNYDQGSGNYQELKKITKWDGRQYTLVSRYALRYSLLETGRKLGLWEVAKGDKLHRAGSQKEQTVIQPGVEMLLSGEILKYPEFDFFGYLITQPRGINQPQNFRVSPVKISHAISMTPFNCEALFNSNIGLANRMREVVGKVDPNPFTIEEHYSFYQYSVVMDLNAISRLEVYINNGEKIDIGESNKYTVEEIKQVGKKVSKVSVVLRNGKKKREIISSDEVIVSIINYFNNVHILKYELKDEKQRNDRIINFTKAILNLRRSIKSRDEDLSPKLLILGLYKNEPYKTYKDKIILKNEYTEEEYDEIIPEDSKGEKEKIVRKVIHRVSRSKKPVFKVVDGEFELIENLDHNDIIGKIKEFLENGNSKVSSVCLAHAPEIEVEYKNKNDGA